MIYINQTVTYSFCFSRIEEAERRRRIRHPPTRKADGKRQKEKTSTGRAQGKK